MSRGLVLACLVLAGCAAHREADPGLVPAASRSPVLVIRDSLADSAKLCAPRVKYTGGPPACMTVGEFRRYVRAQQLVEALP